MIKSSKFWIGFSILAGLILASFIFEIFFDSHIRQVLILYDKDLKPIEAAPFEPSFMFPLGTDALGFDTALKVLQGAKYTLLCVIGIGAMRVIFSFFFAIPMSLYMSERTRTYLDKLLSSFYFLPLTLIAVFVLTPVLKEQLKMPGWKEYFIYSYAERIGIEIFILTILVVPLLGSMIGNMITATLKEEFVTGAKVLGASRWRTFSRHIIPHLAPKLIIVWCQQCVQVLIIFAHLGYLKLFFGGTDVDYNPMIADPPVSTTNEWSGLIGDYYNLLQVHPSIAIGPIIMFAVSIYAFQLINEGYQHHLKTKNKPNLKKKKKFKENKLEHASYQTKQFHFLKEKISSKQQLS